MPASSGAGRSTQALRDRVDVLRVDQRRHEPAVRGGHRLVDRTIQHAQVDGDARSVAKAFVQLDRLDHRHLLGKGAEHDRRPDGIPDQRVDPLDLGTDEAAADECEHRLRGREVRLHLTARGAVDEDEIPDRRSSIRAPCGAPRRRSCRPRACRADPGTPVAMKSKTRASGVSRVSARHLEIDVQVFLERLVGAQLEDGEIVLHHARREPGGRRPERGGEVALGVDIDGEDALAGARAAGAPAPRSSCSGRSLPCPRRRRPGARAASRGRSALRRSRA